MRLVYFGSPEIAVAPLRALLEAGHEVVLVVTNPDRRRRRKGRPEPTPVKAEALSRGIEVTDDPDAALEAGADLGVVVAFGRILPAHLVHGLRMVNLHFSLLPRWRGAAPVERAILAGDTRTGVCVMEVAEGLDTGAVYASAEVPIAERETAAELRGVLVALGSDLLVRTLAADLPEPVQQPAEGVTYAEKLTPAELELRWELPCSDLDRVVRVGGAWSTFRGARLKVLDARPTPSEGEGPPGSLRDVSVRCGVGALELEIVQPEGKDPMPARAWRLGARPAPDERLGR